MGKYLNSYLTKENTEIANKHRRRCSTSFAIRELQIKTIVGYYLTSIRMAEIQKIDNRHYWLGCTVIRSLIHCEWEYKSL